MTKQKTSSDWGKLIQGHTASWKQSQEGLNRPDSKIPAFPRLLAVGLVAGHRDVPSSSFRARGGAGVEPERGGASNPAPPSLYG